MNNKELLGSHRPWFQAVLQSYSNKNIGALAQKQHIDQWTQTEDPDINAHIYGPLVFDKEARNTQGKKRDQQIVLVKLDVCI